MRSVFLYSLETAKSERVTDAMSDSVSPVFDKGGKYLYFLSSTDAGPTKDTSMLSYDRPVTSNVYVVVLRKDLPSPLAPLSDEEGEAKTDAAKTDAAKTGGAEKEKEKPPAVVKVDFEKIGQRILAMPIPARNYTELKTGKEGVLFLVEGPLVAAVERTGYSDGASF